MISRKAIRQFLERERPDFRPWKKLDADALERKARELPTRPPIWSKLDRHQKVCFLIGAMTSRFGFFLDPGMGKTLLNIALARYLKKSGAVKHNLVLVPRKINKIEWRREVRKHSPSSRVCVLRGTTKHKWQQLESTRALFIVETYSGFTRMLCDVAAGKRGKNRLQPNRQRVNQVLQKCDILTCDESTFVGSHRAVIFRILRALAKQMKHVYLLTGTPFGRDPTPLWNQCVLIDQGRSLGETLGLFRAAFFKEKRNYWGGFEYTFKDDKRKLLHRFLAGCTIRYKAREADLPKIREVVKTVRLPHDIQHYYDVAKKHIAAAKGNKREMKNGFLRMRQISSGFLGYKDDDTGKRAEIVFDRNPKMELLMSDCEDICPNYKVLIAHDFIFSGDQIAKELTKRGIGWARIGGGTKDHEAVLDRFDNDPQLRALILNNSCAFGPNLQTARYGLIYESPVSVITRKQLIRRFRRQYSKHRGVFLIDYLAAPVDHQILRFHAEGRDLFEAIVEGEVSAETL